MTTSNFNDFLREAQKDYDFSIDYSQYQIGRSKNNYIRIKKISDDGFTYQINDGGIQILSTGIMTFDYMLEKFASYLTFTGDTVANTLKKLKYISGEDFLNIKK